MIKVSLGDRDIMLDEELSISKFQEIRKNEIKYSKPENLLSLFLDIPVEELQMYDRDNLRFVESYLSSTMVDYKNPVELIDRFWFKDVEYGRVNDFNKIKWGEWVDMEIHSQPDVIQDSIHVLLALMYRPIIGESKKGYILEEYNPATTLERAELFKDAPVRYWIGVANFFLLIALSYTTSISRSLTMKMKILKLTMPILRILPRWLRPKQLRDFISI